MDIQRALMGIYNRTRAHDSNVAAEAVKRNRHLTYDFFSRSRSRSRTRTSSTAQLKPNAERVEMARLWRAGDCFAHHWSSLCRPDSSILGSPQSLGQSGLAPTLRLSSINTLQRFLSDCPHLHPLFCFYFFDFLFLGSTLLVASEEKSLLDSSRRERTKEGCLR